MCLQLVDGARAGTGKASAAGDARGRGCFLVWLECGYFEERSALLRGFAASPETLLGCSNQQRSSDTTPAWLGYFI